MSSYLVWRLLHFVGILGFAAGHGVSAAVTLRLGREREPARLQALLDLSRSTRAISDGSLLLIVVSGVANWFLVDYPSGTGWLWASVAVLVVLAIGGVALAVPHFRRIRRALAEGDAAVLDTLLASSLPWVVFALETGGTLVIVWLMVYKPF
ncbi:MAG TPA: DUF2269 family protein [Actinomycetota bacterium]|nr:DUF2269 family protein [Actinomycetota bacterium]